MLSEEFVISKGGDLMEAFAAIQRQVAIGRTKVTVAQALPRRSDQQNRYLFGVVYPAILKHLEGWDKEDVHDFCLGSWSGWERLEGLGRVRLRPLRRSSKLSKLEFVDFLSHIQRTMAEKGIYIPDPGEFINV